MDWAAKSLPSRGKVLEMSLIQEGPAVVHGRRGKSTNAALTIKAKQCVPNFRFPNSGSKDVAHYGKHSLAAFTLSVTNLVMPVLTVSFSKPSSVPDFTC